MVLRKVYNKNNKRTEWALVSKNNQRKVLQYFGKKKPSKQKYLSAERRVQMFKHMGSMPRYKRKVYRRYKKGGRKGKGQTYWVVDYNKLVRLARKKGYKLPRYVPGKGPLQITETDIPESFQIDGFTLPVEEGMAKWSKKDAQKFKNKFFIAIDDDEPVDVKVRAAAHELGHVHMFNTKKGRHTEARAERIGADIVNMPVERFSSDMIFDQDINKPGIQLPIKKMRKRRKK